MLLIQPSPRNPIRTMPDFQPVSIEPKIVLRRIFPGAPGLA